MSIYESDCSATLADSLGQHDLFVVDPANGKIYQLSGLRATAARRLLLDAARCTEAARDAPHFSLAEAHGGGQLTIDAENSEPPILAEREAQILQLVADGHSNEAIASMLHFSVATIRRTTSTIYRRLGARNRASAIARAHELHLLG